MLVLFETPAGYAIFKLLEEHRLDRVEDICDQFKSPEEASKILKLKHFEKFQNTTEALACTTANVEGKVSKKLKKALKKVVIPELQEKLLVADAKLGNAIKDKLNLQCVSNTSVQRLIRWINDHMENLILSKQEFTAMVLGLSHGLSRYKIKFNPDKVDTMITQAICLLDDLDKELNNYIMRCREWYGWHFPELGKILTDNTIFVKAVKLIGTRQNAASTDLSDILPEDVEEQVKQSAEISMGTEIADEDIINIQNLCDQITEITDSRARLFNYLQARMMAIAPNVTALLGEIIGARLISHAGSLINLAKHPASTVQILGAEKALFRALKSHQETPKFGLIFHSSLVTSASVKNKGKISRSLAAKAALASRYDAFNEETDAESVQVNLGVDHLAKLELRLKMLEEGNLRKLSGSAKAKAKFEKYQSKSEILKYTTNDDVVISPTTKRKFEEDVKPLIEEISTPSTSAGEVQKTKKKKIKKEKN